MFNCERILVVTHPKDTQHLALKRAVFIAKQTSAKVVAMVNVFNKAYDMSEILNQFERNEVKNALTKEAKEDLEKTIKNLDFDIEIECLAVWNSVFYKGVIDACEEKECDLVIKAAKKHSKLETAVFTPNDWHIARKCSANIMLVKHESDYSNFRVVSALGVSATDKKHQCLSDKVSHVSAGLADLFKGKLFLANTFAGAPVHISVEMPTFEPDVYNKTVQEKHLEKMYKVADNVSVNHDDVHVLEGLPEDRLPKLCRDLCADLLVIGSVGRQGLSAVLLGNTAEQLIDRTDSDLFIVKPDPRPQNEAKSA